MQITKDESGLVLQISGDVDIGVAEEFQLALRDLFHSDASVAIDLAGMNGFDTTALQLLVAARKTAVRTGKQLRIVGMPKGMVDMAGSLGIAATDLMPETSEGGACGN
jgi:anti-anti-sigma factor